jgi:Tol biopolymer transport system component
MSADGRFVAFQSDATNLVPGDTNGAPDIFVRDRQLGTTTRVSVDSAGQEANFGAFLPSISADGRFVVFGSLATNLVADDTNGEQDIFVHDRVTGTTELVSANSAEQQGNGTSFASAISADGRYVAFASHAVNLIPGDTNGQADVFVRDRQAGTTERVSVTSAGQQQDGPALNVAINGDGRFVAFDSFATNLVPGDTNDTLDVFVHDQTTGTTERVDVGTAGQQASGGGSLETISADGRYIVFDSGSPNLVPGDTNDPNQPDVFVRDRLASTTERVSVGSGGEQANAASFGRAISADGRIVALASDASNLVPADTNGFGDAFVRDRVAFTTKRVSVSGTGDQGDGHSGASGLSADGTLVAFVSGASNLVPGDTNDTFDVFVAGIELPPPSTPDCSTSNRGQIIAQNGDRATFSGRAETSGAGQPSGSETYNDRGPVDRFVMRSVSIEAIVCAGRDASVFGQALVDGDEVSFQINLHDGGGRHRDTYRVQLSSGYDSGDQTLRTGNVTVR